MVTEEQAGATQIVDLAALEGVEDYRTLEVPVPEWDGFWIVRTMTGAEHIAIEFKSMNVAQDGTRTRNEQVYYAYKLAHGTHAPQFPGVEVKEGKRRHVDDDGNESVHDDVVEVVDASAAVRAANNVIRRRSGIPLNRIFTAIDNLNPAPGANIDAMAVMLLSNRFTFAMHLAAMRSGLMHDMLKAERDGDDLTPLCEDLERIAAYFQAETYLEELGIDPRMSLLTEEQLDEVKAHRSK